jgi:Protein of unknown function (DUF1186)
MVTSQYSLPVAQLLTYGDAHDHGRDWSEYLSLGITAAHTSALIQLLEDESLFLSESEDDDYWTVVHAWRTVAALKVEAAIPALISVLGRWGDDDPWWDWINEEFPDVFQEIGTATIPALVDFIADSHQLDFPRGTAARALLGIAQKYPESRIQCVESITRLLQAFTDNTPELNAYFIEVLADLKAIESAAVIEQAFQLNCVEEAFVGDWDEVQVALGLKTREEVPLKRFTFIEPPTNRERYEPFPNFGSFGGESKKTKTKAKRKQQKDSRRKNRKKK